MRVLLDTHILVAGLLSPKGPPGRLLEVWLAGRFCLVTSAQQLDELRRVLDYEHLRKRIDPTQVRDFVENIEVLATTVDELPDVHASPDPADDAILAAAVAGKADFVVSGDKADLLALQEIEGIPIVTARTALERLGIDDG